MATISYVTALRNSRMTAVLTALDAGAGAALGKLYTGSSPGVNSAATGTLLGTVTCSDPAGTVGSGKLTFSAITADSSADADGTAGYMRFTDSDSNAVMDLDAGATGSGAAVQLNNVNIVTGGTISVSSAEITEGNA